jgi:prepilin-type N-terminal cleavage/methylation domain-containing protein
MRVSQVVSVRRRPGHGFGLIEFLVAAAIVALAVL